ncbi:MAG: hypothetical protein A4E63_01071 [Syntrophorhabdus sp. PtaU1.Bin050]|nr:MAG: hypothetical protein A4E63_01071 [Syntrophorhabdus sp. PtaU1.Bin050]
MIVAPDDARNAHQGVIDNDRKIIGRCIVAPKNHKVIQFLAFEGDFAPNEIIKRNLSRDGCFEPNYKGPAFAVPGVIPAGPVIVGFSSLLEGCLPLFFQGFRRAVAFVCFALREKFKCMFPVKVHSFLLKVGSFIPFHPEPGKTLEDVSRILLFGPFHIRILNPQKEDTLCVFGGQVVEEGGPCPTDVKVPCRAWCKPCFDH